MLPVLPVVVWAVAASVTAATTLLDLDTTRLGDTLPTGWTVRAVRGAEAPRALVVDSGGERFLRLEGRGTAAWFVRELDPDTQPAGTVLSWRWRVPRAPIGADIRVRDRDDAARRVFVVFDHRARFSRVPRTIFSRARSARRRPSAGDADGPTPTERAATPGGAGACRRHLSPAPRRACALRDRGASSIRPTRVRTVTVLQHGGLFQRNVRVAPAQRCVLQTGVFGSALRAHRIGSPAAGANVSLT